MKEKIINLRIFALICAIGFTSASCEDEDKNPLGIDAIVNGAVLSTVEVSGNQLNRFEPSESDLTVTLWFNDHGDNDSMERVDVFVEFIDTSPVDGQVLDIPEAQIATLTLEDFNETISGYPANTFTLNGQEALDALDLDSDDISGGDIFILRYSLVLMNGQVFSSDNVGTNVETTSHLAPFRYSTEVFCPTDIIPEGTWTVNMEDSYGDGWQPTTSSGGGPGIVVTLTDGTVYEIGLCTPYEDPGYDCTDGFSSGTDTFEVPEGVGGEFIYNGDFWGEMSFEIIAPNGNVVASAGSGTSAGPITVNLCD